MRHNGKCLRHSETRVFNFLKHCFKIAVCSIYVSSEANNSDNFANMSYIRKMKMNRKCNFSHTTGCRIVYEVMQVEKYVKVLSNNANVKHKFSVKQMH
jgi:pentose-5-phosphate-3-epimerase